MISKIKINVIISVLYLVLILMLFLIFLYYEKIEFSIFSPRTQFFIWLFLLSIFSVVFSYKRKTYFFLIIILNSELFLSIFLFTSSRFGFQIAPSYIPPRISNNHFKYHPLLQVIPKENIKLEYNNIEISHNKFSQRVIKNNAVKDSIKISIFGGSTTYDMGVSDNYTWVQNLQKLLGDRYLLVNNGVPGYSTVEHLIQTIFYIDRGLKNLPDCAVYYVGWNDIRNLGLPKLDRAFANYHLLDVHNSVAANQLGKLFLFSPLLYKISSLFGNYFDSIPNPKYEYNTPLDIKNFSFNDSKQFIFSFENLKIISHLNNLRGIKTIFITQILNKQKLTSHQRYGWLPLIADKDVWKVQSKFNEKLFKEFPSTLNVDIDKFNDADFVDNGHFSKLGAVKFANLIKDQIIKFCK